MTGNGESSRAIRILSLIGGAALLIAMATDVISVIGRHVGWPLVGSIEAVQAAVVISAAVGMVVATVERSHAIVHVVVNRLAPGPKRRLLRVSWLAASLFFLALAAGAAWSFALHLGGYEQSELVGIPYAPLRLALAISCATVAAVFAWQARQGDAK